MSHSRIPAGGVLQLEAGTAGDSAYGLANGDTTRTFTVDIGANPCLVWATVLVEGDGSGLAEGHVTLTCDQSPNTTLVSAHLPAAWDQEVSELRFHVPFVHQPADGDPASFTLTSSYPQSAAAQTTALVGFQPLAVDLAQ